MTSLDWKRLLALTPEDISEQEKEELYFDVTNFECKPNISLENLQALFKVAQEILKFKGEQVESLLSEIDNLAARQGEEEARRHQSLLDEVESLQEQLLRSQKFDTLSGSNIGLDELRQELVNSELKNEQLISELQAREHDLLKERNEVEKFANQVMILEREKVELRSELVILQRESLEQQEARLQAESPKTPSSKRKDLIETVRHKNNHITQLLRDIETLEKENNMLKLKVAALQNDTTEKSELIAHCSGENTNLKLAVSEFQERIVILEEQNDALKMQMREIAVDKDRRDEQLDQLGVALDARLGQWQELLVQKDTELIELKQRLSQVSAQFPNTYVNSTKNHLANMAQSLERKEEQVEELQQQLAQSKLKLTESDNTISQLTYQLKSKTDKQEESSRVNKIKQELAEAQNRLKVLEERVADAENDADVKAEEMTEMVIQLREYETGVFGLPEAMEQIKELQKQKKVRDRHIEQLIQSGNQLQSDANHLEEENLALRAELGLDVDAVVRVDGVLAKYKADQQKLSDITQQLEGTNSTLLTLKVQNRIYKKTIARLKSQLKNVGYEPENVSSEDDSNRFQQVQGISEETKAMLVREAEILENKLQDVIDENEALRKGMHEILDSVRSHDGTSVVHIESACLERLLEALDSRHLSGWYHPAMRLQAQLNMVEGNNAALREQLRVTRYNEHEATAKLHKALIKVDILQSEVQKLVTITQSVDKDVNKEELQPHIASKAMQFIEALKSKKESPDQESGIVKSHLSKIEQDYTSLSQKLSETELLMTDQKELYETDRESWQNVRKGLQNEIDSLNEKVATISAELKEYTQSWKAFQEDPDTVRTELANATVRLAVVSSENEKLKRKCLVVQELDLQVTNDKDVLHEELFFLERSSTEKISELTRAKDNLEADLKAIQNIHSECFPSSEFEEMKDNLNKLTVKHRELLASKTIIDKQNTQLINKLRRETELLRKYADEVSCLVGNPEQVFDKFPTVISQNKTEEIDKEMKNHADKMYALVKDQLKESEDHCKDLEKQLTNMVQQNLASQLMEAELRNQLVDCVSHSQFMDLKKQLAHSEKTIAELRGEQARLERCVALAEEKLAALEQLRHCHDYQKDALQRQVLELSASSEDKLTIGRLTRELLRTQESEHVSSKKVIDLKNNLEQLDKACEEKENFVKSIQEQFLSEKSDMKLKYRWLAQTVSELHQRYLGHLSLMSAESLQSSISYAQFEKTNVLTWATESLDSDKLVEMLKNKYNEVAGNTATKLQELKLKVSVQTLESQLEQTQGQLQRLEKLNAVLQEELLNQEKSWEKKQVIWEQDLLKTLIPEIPTAEKKMESKEPEIKLSDSNIITHKSSEDIPLNVSKDKEEKETMTSPRPNMISEPALVIDVEQTKTLNTQLHQVTLFLNEQTKKLNQYEGEIAELRSKLDMLKKQLDEKERKLQQKERQLLELQTCLSEKTQDKVEEETTEILALKATVASLQNIVNQKEETIGRYQTLLQECRDEHSSTVASLQRQLTNLQQLKDTKEISSPKDKSQVKDDKSSAMRVILERYLARVHQLEDDLNQSREHAARLSVDLSSSQQQTDKWTHTAEERLKTIQEMKQKLDSARSKEDLTDSNSEIMEKSSEIIELNKIISNLKAKLESRETVSAARNRMRGELDRANKRLDVAQNQNSELKNEVQRLRKQLTLRQTSTPKSETVSTAREEVLQKKIKHLEEQMSEYQIIIQRGKEIHKSKCDEEFGKWEERKRWQASNEKLKTQLKEKTSQVEALRASIDRFKDTIIRLEKEKITLEGKLKSVKVPDISQNLVDELERDRAKLKEELMAVRMKTTHNSTLTDVVEAQERKIATLKVAQKGEAVLAEEVERLLERKTRLQQTNLRLESQNLELKMQLEKCRLSELTPRDDINSETESVGGSPKGRASRVGKSRGDLERAVIVLKRVVERLQADNKKLHAARLNDVHDKGYMEKLQIELQSCQENYLDAVDKCSSLEDELQKYKEKLSLLQNTNLAEELSLTKTQLSQKCQLLSKVKVLLENAVVREKALKEQVRDLEKLVPPERLRGTYHERKY